jgi:hypothetical protein
MSDERCSCVGWLGVFHCLKAFILCVLDAFEQVERVISIQYAPNVIGYFHFYNFGDAFIFNVKRCAPDYLLYVSVKYCDLPTAIVTKIDVLFVNRESEVSERGGKLMLCEASGDV